MLNPYRSKLEIRLPEINFWAIDPTPSPYAAVESMAHPLIPEITDLATPIAAELGLELVTIVFHTNQNPPALRVDIRNPDTDTGLDDCARMSRALEAALDATEIVPFAYMLEVSSPGTSRELTTDREFTAFGGFPVRITPIEIIEGKKEWQGQLIGRDDTAIYLSQKGRKIAIPRESVSKVSLDDNP
jgi:ribosome maturation factor RimP